MTMDVQEVEASDRPAFLALAVIPVWTSLSNAAVLYCFLRNRSLRQNLSNFIIASMAMADLMLGLFVLPFSVYRMVKKCWNLGYESQLVWLCMDVLLSASSIANLLAISVYRYLAIAYPYRFRYTASKRHVQTLLLTAWSMAFGLTFALVLETTLSTPWKLRRKLSCQYLLGTDAFLVYGSLISFFIPLCIMTFMGIRSIQLLKRNKLVTSGLQRVARMTIQSNAQSADELDGRVDMIAQSYSGDLVIMSRRPRNPPQHQGAMKSAGKFSYIVPISTKEQRAIRVLLVVFTIFVIAWFPFFSLQLVQALAPQESQARSLADQLIFPFAWPGYCTSCVNPIVYAVFSPEFRKAFKELFLKRSGKSQSPVAPAMKRPRHTSGPRRALDLHPGARRHASRPKTRTSPPPLDAVSGATEFPRTLMITEIN